MNLKRKATPIVLVSALMLGGCDALTQQGQQLQDQLASLNLVIAQTAGVLQTVQANLPQAVWITIYEVEGIDENGDVVPFYDGGPNGDPINLMSTSDVAALLDTRSVPARRYTKLRLRLGTTVTVVDKNGASADYQVPNTSGPDFTLEIPVDVQLAANTIASLIMQVDLNALSQAIDEASQTIDLGLVLDGTSNDPTLLDGVQAKLEGTAVDIDPAGSRFTLARSQAPDVRVRLHPTLAVIIDESSGQPMNLADMRAGSAVAAYGSFDPLRLQMVAVTVAVNPEPVSRGDSDQVRQGVVEAEGWLSSYNSTDGSATLRLHEASFRPTTTTIQVVGLSTARYVHGSADLLQDGVKVEIKGTWNGTTLYADIVDIEGALPVNAPSGSSEPMEVEGAVRGWDPATQTLTLRVEEVDGRGNPPSVGSDIDVDLGDAWFKRGAPACLIPNVEVELYLLYDDGSYRATVVKVDDDGCRPFTRDDDEDHDAGYEDDDHDDKGRGDSAPSSEHDDDDRDDDGRHGDDEDDDERGRHASAPTFDEEDAHGPRTEGNHDGDDNMNEDAPHGAPSGNAPSGNAPSGNAPSGNAPSGNAPSGNAPSGNAPSGNAGGGQMGDPADHPNTDDGDDDHPMDDGAGRQAA